MSNTYAMRNQVRCSVIFTTGGVAVDPTTVTAVVVDPDGLKTSYVYGTDAAVIKDGVGAYHLDVYASSAGTWTYSFQATGTATGAGEKTFVVAPSAV